MRMSIMRAAFALAVLLAIPTTALADEFGYRAWGVHGGISETPDQFVGGVHVDLGEFAPNVRFQPSADFGLGDHAFTLQGNLMVSYYFPIQAKVTPYAGGQLSAAFYDLDSNCAGFGLTFGRPGNCDDTQVEIGPAGVGGIEMEMQGGGRFMAEIQLGFGDLPDAKLVAGWTF